MGFVQSLFCVCLVVVGGGVMLLGMYVLYVRVVDGSCDCSGLQGDDIEGYCFVLLLCSYDRDMMLVVSPTQEHTF